MEEGGALAKHGLSTVIPPWSVCLLAGQLAIVLVPRNKVR
jgi:hypothetical protein